MEAAPLLTIDQGDFQYRRDEDKPFENLVAEPGSIDVYVPRQTAYPAQFVAEIGVGPTTQYFEFVRESAESPWRTPYQAAADGFPEPPSPIAVDRDGYATLRADRHRQAEGRAGRRSRAPRPLLLALRRAGPREVEAVPGRPGHERQPEVDPGPHREVDATYEFSAVTAPHAAYKTKDGGAVVFFAYSSRELAEAPGGGTLRVQPSGLPGPQVPPGRYLSTDTTRITLVAAAIPPAKPKSGRITILGRYTGSVAATGVPAGPSEA